jgi:hypothetical protein
VGPCGSRRWTGGKLPHIVIMRGCKTRCRKRSATRGSKRPLTGVVVRRPLPRSLVLVPRRVTVAALTLGSLTPSLLSICISPSPHLPRFHPLRCLQRLFAVLPPLQTILPRHRQAPLGSIAVPNLITLSQRCQISPPHFTRPTRPPPPLTNKRSSIYLSIV